MQYVLRWQIEDLKSPYCFFEEIPVIEVSLSMTGNLLFYDFKILQIKFLDPLGW